MKRASATGSNRCRSAVAGFSRKAIRGQPVEALQTMLALYGYRVSVDGAYNAETTAAVRAFQRHFRPQRVDGIADASTIGTLHKLLTALPTVA
jgi:N-acetylmuramoyl-L-alanine amidase